MSDKEYENKNVRQLTKDEFLECLKKIADEERYYLLETVYFIYLSKSKESSCSELADRYDRHYNHFNVSATNLAKYIEHYFNITSLPRDKNGKDQHWPLLFNGRYDKYNNKTVFIWQLRDELSSALKDLLENANYIDLGSKIIKNDKIRYWVWKHCWDGSTPQNRLNLIEKAFENKYALMQYEYGIQNTRSVTLNLNRALRIREGDIIFLFSDSRTVHAYGIAKKTDLTFTVEPLSRQELQEKGYSSKNDNNEIIPFKNNAVLYSNLSEENSSHDEPWGQRVDVNSWELYSKEGISCYIPSNHYIDKSPYPAVREITASAAQYLTELLNGESNPMLPEKESDFCDLNESHKEGAYSKNMILFGPPGTGKTYVTEKYAVGICESIHLDDLDENFEKVRADYLKLKKEGRIEFITFHQSYGYENFISGLCPVLSEKNDIATNGQATDMQYQIKDGIFKQFCDRASKDSEHPYVFVIDEINRGNISKIFGELITLIETTKRVGASESMQVKLPYSKENELFGVPNNVYIIGTMNTADKSISHIDTALRRRFHFIEMMPDVEILKNIGIEKYEYDEKSNILSRTEDETSETILDIPSMLNKINERIEFLLDREHTIGHAFFTHLGDKFTKKDLEDIFKNKIIPLLQEYFYDDYSKIWLVLGDNAKTSADFCFIKRNYADPKTIFNNPVNLSNSVDLSDYVDTDKKDSFKINDTAFDHIQSYIQIYDNTKNSSKTEIKND